MVRRGKAAWVTMFLVFTLIGCAAEGKDLYGQPAPGSVTAVKIKAILENPDAYKGKDVVLEGFYGGECAGCAGFFLKEGIETVEVYPQFALPGLTKGKHIKVYGVVRSMGQSQIVIEGKGLVIK